MKNPTKSIFLTALAMGLSGGVWAADNKQPTARFLAGMGLTIGGDKLASVPFTDGSTESVKAGDLVHLYLGGEFSLGGPVAVQTTIGYHVADTKAASNGSVKFVRTPVDVLALYAIDDKFRLGAGARFVSGAQLRSSGVGTNIVGAKRDYKASTGLVVEGEYRSSNALGFKLRAVSEKYKQENTTKSHDGSHVGLMMSYYFGK